MRAFALLGIIIGTTSCARPSGEPEIRIGLLALLTTELAPQSGIPSLEGAQIAIAEINAAGGVKVNGRARQLRLIARDYAPRPDAAASGARALINLDSIDVLIGPQISVHAIAAASVAEDARVPMLSPMASNPAVTDGRHFVFRLAFLDRVQGNMLARYAREDLRAKRAAMLFDEASPYGRDIAALFRETFERLGGKLVASETFTTDERTDFRAQLRRIAAASPEVVLLPNFSAVDSIQVRQARALGIKATFLGSDTWDPDGMSNVPEAAGTVVAAQWNYEIPRPQTREFVERYRGRHGEPPRSTAALTYDAIHLVAAAIARAGTTDGDAVARAIATTTSFEGVSGRIAFVGTGDPQRAGVLSRIAPGGNAIVRVVEPR